MLIKIYVTLFLIDYLSIILPKDLDLNKSLIILLTLIMGSSATLSSAPLGAPPQFNQTQKQTPKLQDGKSIVLGKYKSRQDADLQLSSLLDFMDSSSKIVNLELEHGFDYAVTEENNLYVVSIEPFIDETVLNDVLSTVIKRYPKAHAEICKECVREEMLLAKARATVEQEVLDNAIANDSGNTHVKVSVEKEDDVVVDPSAPQAKSSLDAIIAKLPFDVTYIGYGLGGLALFILILLVMRKPKKTSDKEMRELYAEARKLEKEMEKETASKNSAVTEDVAAPELEKRPEPTPAPEPIVAAPEPIIVPVKEEVIPVQEPVFVAPVVEKKVIKTEVSSPKTVAALNHKLREPNKDVASVTKENFKEFEGLRLLIAEDNLINQKVIVGLLKGSGINIKIANDGQECMEILAEDPNYQIILMDAHMPRIDGLEATRLIRANPDYAHITVMALSGDTGADDVRKMRESGMEEQLEKPLKIAALYQAIHCYFDPSMIGGPGEELPEIHLDNSLGLEMLGGDVELYHEILKEFQALYNDSDEKIEQWLKDEDYNSAKALLLDVKGIGESIGTAELTQTSDEFREALIGNKKVLYSKLMNQYRSQLKSILADIAEV